MAGVLLAGTAAGTATATAVAQIVQTASGNLTIGVLDGPDEYTFGKIRDLDVGPDGSIYVLDELDAVVKVFDAGGAPVTTFGGVGGGPGEFRAPRAIAVSGDTVAVYDTRLQRLTLFTARGEVIATRRIAVMSWFTTGLATLPTGEFLLALEAGYGIPPRPEREGRWWLIRLSPDGEVLDTLMATAGPDLLVYRDMKFLTAIEAPFQRRPSWAVARDGRVAFGRGDRYRIEIHAAPRPGGTYGTSRAPALVERALPNREATDDDIDGYRDRYLDHEDLTPRLRRAYEKIIGDAEFPETWPAYSDLHFDDRGRLWVERRAFGEGPAAVWHVLDATGALRAEAEVRASLDVRAIADSCLYGITADELGVQRITRYCIAPML